ncbi:hypothetical protein ACJMK2_025487 [Sinanodonta woodiana]|uniref:Uncharacterized protein n=1 Tax=Sinanodonta woodiana TaxID=1069815 RepID=A0ABD3XGM4_SINWO
MFRHVPNMFSANKAVQESQLLNSPHSQQARTHGVSQHVVNQNNRGNSQNLRGHLTIPDVKQSVHKIQQHQTGETFNRLVSPVNHASNTAGIDTRLQIKQNTGLLGRSEHTRVLTRNETFRPPGKSIEIASNDGSKGNTVMTRRVPNTFRSNEVHVPAIHIMPQLPRVSDLNNGATLSSPARLAQTFTVDRNVDQSGIHNIHGGGNRQLFNIGNAIQRPTQWTESSNPLNIQRGSALSEPNFGNRNAPFPITNGISVQGHHVSGSSLSEVSSLQLRYQIQPTVMASSIVHDLSGISLQTGGVPINMFENPVAASNWLSTSGGTAWPGFPFMGESPDSPDVPDVPDPPSNENENENENQQSKAITTKLPTTVKSLDKNQLQHIQELQMKPSTPAPSIAKKRVITLWTPMPLTSKMLGDLVQVPVLHTERHVALALNNKVNSSGIIFSDLNKSDTPLKVDSLNEHIKRIAEENALTGRQLDKTSVRTPIAFSDLKALNESIILQDTQQKQAEAHQFEKRVTAMPSSSIDTGIGRLSMNTLLSMTESRHSDNSGTISQSNERIVTNIGSTDVLLPITEQQSPHFKAVNKTYLQVIDQANNEIQSRLNSQQIHSIQNTENGSVGSFSNETINMKIDPISKIATQVRNMIEILSQLIDPNINTTHKINESTQTTVAKFANNTADKRGAPTLIGVDQTITGSISGNGSDQHTCGPFAKQFYCVGKDMFANVPGIADWCVQKCQNDSCLLSICYCSCSALTRNANTSEINKHLNTTKKIFSHSSKTTDNPVEKGQLFHSNLNNTNGNQNNNINRSSKRMSSSNLTLMTRVDSKQKIFKKPFASKLNPLPRKHGFQPKHISTISTISTTEEPQEVDGEVETEDLQTTTIMTTEESETTAAHYTTTVQDYFTDTYYDYTTTPEHETFRTPPVLDIKFRETLKTSSSPKVNDSKAETTILDSQNRAVIGEQSPGKGILTEQSGNNTKFTDDTSKPASPQQHVSTDGVVKTELNEKGQGHLGNGTNGSYSHLGNESRVGQNLNKSKHSQNATGEDGNNVSGDNLRGKAFDRTTPSMRAWDRSTGGWRSRQTTASWNNNRNIWDSSRSVITPSWNTDTFNDRQTRPPPWNRNARNWDTDATTPTRQGHDNWQQGTQLESTSDSNWRNRPRQVFNSWNGRSDRSAMRRSGDGSFVGRRNDAQDQWSNVNSDNFLRDSPSSWPRDQAPSGWGNDWRFSPSNDGRRSNNRRNLRERWNRRTTTPPSGEVGEETKGAEGAD